MAFNRVSLILAGGSGTRFWPVSTPERPKQFLSLASPNASLLQQSLERARVVSNQTFIATSHKLLDVTRSATSDAKVIAEPLAKNTLGALIWALANIKTTCDDHWENYSIAVLTADHSIEPLEKFASTVDKALTLAEQTGALVTIGIKPTRPATEYGYIELGEELGSVFRFTEKPDAQTAKEFVEDHKHLWNSGMFFWTLEAVCNAIKKCTPEAFQAMEKIEAALRNGNSAGALNAFEEIQATSIDYALMERADNVKVVEAEFQWDDLGSWDALSRTLPQDSRGNVSHGKSRMVDSSNNVCFNSIEGTRVSMLGVEDLIVVVTSSEILVCKKDQAQDIRKLSE